MIQVAAQNKRQQPACAALPPVYALELLTIFAWEQGCGKESFKMAEGLKTVLELVQQHQQLCVYWTVNYSFEDPDIRTHLLGQLQKKRCRPTSPLPSLHYHTHPRPLSPWSHCVQKGSGWDLGAPTPLLTLLPSGLFTEDAWTQGAPKEARAGFINTIKYHF